jgi:predicted transcriptional regulator
MALGEDRHLTIGVGHLADAAEAAKRAAFAKEAGAAVTFESFDLLWSVLTPRRLAILKAMSGQERLSTRAVARRVDRDVKAVHSDLKALASAGLIDQAKAGFLFPYASIHVDFTLHQAA